MTKEETSEKICIDTQMITHSILKEDFKSFLLENIGEDFPYTTLLSKNEVIGNLKYKLYISWGEAKKKFDIFEKEIRLKYLEFKQEYFEEGIKIFNRIISLGFKVKNKNTFMKDCVNISVIIKNKIKIFFCNDEELERYCKRLNYDLEFIRIPIDSNKIIKDAFNKSKFQYWKHHQRAKR